MNTVKAKKIKKTSWTETIKAMEIGSGLVCTMKERLSAAPRITDFKKKNPGAEFSEWKELSENKYMVIKLK